MKKIMALAALAVVAVFADVGMAQEGSPPDGCRLVTVSRENINQAKPDIPITFRGEGSAVASLKHCNPSGKTAVISVTPSLTDGGRIVLRTKGGAGTAGLPDNYNAGEAHNVWCGIEGGKIVFKLYKVAWGGGLKNNLHLTDATAELGDEITAHIAGCKASMPPELRAKLAE